MAKKVLVVDDDPALIRLFNQILTQNGYVVVPAGSGEEALRIMFEEKPGLVLLDVVMPGMDGWETCSRIRDFSDVPVIMLTGKKSAEDDIVRGLEYGADEYLLKPVGNKELMARVRATLRRAELPPYLETRKKAPFNDEYITIDINERKILINGEKVKLTPREFKLLGILVDNAGSIMTHRQILEKVWGWEYIDDVDYVRIYISHLRQKIEPEPNQPRYIFTESGVGYYFKKIN
ncbi:response regulator transcription factor [Chloroflexota bacterium]